MNEKVSVVLPIDNVEASKNLDSTEKIRKLHSLELEIAKEVKRICEKNNIKYFLTAGSALGAVRHGGFIPWDDDMDIGMLRDDYERFVTACKTELGDRFFLQTWDTDKEYPFSYAKIRLNGTRFVESFSENSGMHNGIFVDIFPFDNVPDSKLCRKIQSYKYFICKRLLWIKKGMGKNLKSSKKQMQKYYIFLWFSKLFQYDNVKEYYKKIQKKYNNQITEKIVTDGSYSYFKESIARCWADELKPILFENEEFLTYKNREEYLSYFYGDYLKLPPPEKRNRHEALEIDFGEY